MTTTEAGPRHLHHLIGGEPGGEPSVERFNPADPEDLVSVTPLGTPDDVAAAVAAAAAAQPAWAGRTGPARGAVLRQAAELLRARADEAARDLTREEGKTLVEARGEVLRAADILSYHGGEAWRTSGETLPSATPSTLVYTRREPIGVVAVITPWNFPIAIPAWKIAPALVSGNAVVFKPASMTGVSARHLVDVLVEAGLPTGVINVIYGAGGQVGDALVDDPGVGAITFTGSTAVGLGIHRRASERMVRVQLEMGGKNPLVVLDDADPAVAARIAAVGGWGLTGQACTATSRVIATPGAVGPFVDAMRAEAERYRPGNGLHDGVLMGPVVSESQLATDLSYVDIARQDGGEVVLGGDADGLRFSPTLVGSVRPDDRIAVEEVFGPVISVIEASDIDEAVAVANDVPYGLCAGICTRDLASAHVFAERVRAGVVKVNRPTTGLDLNVPFGGIKASSTGTFREQGASAVDFFTWSKSVYLGFDG